MSKGAETIGTIERAVEVLELAGVEFYELRATRPDTVIVKAPAPVDEITLSTGTAVRAGEHGVDYRCTLTVEFDRAQLVVDGAVLYRTERPVTLEQSVLDSFGDNVAIMTLIPYLRQAITDLALRLGFNVTLPIIRRGAITFTLQEEEQPSTE